MCMFWSPFHREFWSPFHRNLHGNLNQETDDRQLEKSHLIKQYSHKETVSQFLPR